MGFTWCVLVVCLGSLNAHTFKGTKAVESYLENLCGAYTNMDKALKNALKDVGAMLDKKGLQAGDDPIEVLEKDRLFCLYVFQKGTGRIQAYTLSYDPKEQRTFVLGATCSRAVQHIFDHHKSLSQQRVPYDHIQRPVTRMWSSHKKGHAIGLISSVALAQKELSPEREKALGGGLAGLLQSTAWNGLVGGRGMWFMDGHTFTLRVPAVFKGTPGYIDHTFVLELERTGMYTITLKREPFWRKN